MGGGGAQFADSAKVLRSKLKTGVLEQNWGDLMAKLKALVTYPLTTINSLKIYIFVTACHKFACVSFPVEKRKT